MMSHQKVLSCLALLVLFALLSVARSDVPNCDGTEAESQVCPLVDTAFCKDCPGPCTLESCYEPVQDYRNDNFGCKKTDPPPKVLTKKCVAATYDPPPVGPPVPITVPCADVKPCQDDGSGGCEVKNSAGLYTKYAQWYTTLDSPDCAEAK
jgi:hypothetical protein